MAEATEREAGSDTAEAAEETVVHYKEAPRPEVLLQRQQKRL